MPYAPFQSISRLDSFSRSPHLLVNADLRVRHSLEFEKCAPRCDCAVALEIVSHNGRLRLVDGGSVLPWNLIWVGVAQKFRVLYEGCLVSQLAVVATFSIRKCCECW